jgi:hypothetical protein
MYMRNTTGTGTVSSETQGFNSTPVNSRFIIIIRETERERERERERKGNLHAGISTFYFFIIFVGING